MNLRDDKDSSSECFVVGDTVLAALTVGGGVCDGDDADVGTIAGAADSGFSRGVGGGVCDGVDAGADAGGIGLGRGVGGDVGTEVGAGDGGLGLEGNGIGRSGSYAVLQRD